MTDLSDKYASEHNAKIYFSARGEKIFFKSFLSDLSVAVQFKKTEPSEDLSNDGTTLYNEGSSFTYNFSLSVPFSNKSEAILGKQKIDKLVSMFSPNREERRKNMISPGVKVMLVNLICNGLGSTDVDLHGVRCTADSLNVEYNSEMGWFDNGREFYSKLYTLSFSLRIIPAFEDQYLCMGYNEVGEYSNLDVRHWPFQVSLEDGFSSFSENRYENQYESDHSAYVIIKHSSAYNPSITERGEIPERLVVYSAFLENFSKEHSYEYAVKDFGFEIPTPKQIKAVNYKLTMQVPSNNQRQARKNMAKAQTLLRILAPMEMEQGPSSNIYVKFANLIDEEVYIDNITIKIDTDLGFFEKWGNFYFKNYTLDLTMISGFKSTPVLDTTEEEESEDSTILGGDEDDDTDDSDYPSSREPTD